MSGPPWPGPIARPARHPLPRCCRGLTLIEVLVGAMIVGLVLVSASWAISHASTNRHIHEESPVNAALVAKELHELALTLPTAPGGAGPATTGAGVVALDSLDGASFSPPIDSFRADMASLRDWRQLASISVYALDDLERPVSEGFASASKSSTSLYRLTVTVMNGRTEMGTWWWWINP